MASISTSQAQTQDNIDSNNALYVHPLENAGSSIISIQFDGMGYKYWRHGVLRAVSVKNKIGFFNGKVVSSMGRSSQSQYLVYLDWRSGNVVTIW